MGEKYVVVGNSLFDHNLKIGSVVEVIRKYEDGAFECEGLSTWGDTTKQDVHRSDLKAVEKESEHQ